MTQQEFVKKECKSTIYDVLGFRMGLTKGLEIAKEFAEWGQRNKYKQEGGKKGNGNWFRRYTGYGGSEPKIYTTDELLTIFLTEKYGQ